MPRRFSKTILLAIGTAAAIAMAVPALADNTVAELRFQNGRFEPVNVQVPANIPLKVRVTNAGAAAIEFESFELHRERVVTPGETITVYIPPLAPGNYKFFDDFHHDAPEGAIISK